MRSVIHGLYGPILLAGLFLSAGCSKHHPVWDGPTGTVSGSVTFKEQPVAEGVISLYDRKRGIGYSADIVAGEFRWTDPVLTGTYEVTISPPPSPLPTEGTDPGMPQRKYADIPVRYRSASTSGLVAEIIEGGNTLSLTMSPP